MQLELPIKIEELQTQLELALADEKHTLAESLKNVMEASEALITMNAELHTNNDLLIRDLEVIGASFADVVAFVKDLHLLLNANLEIANQIKGMPEILKLIGQFVLSPSAVKAGVVRNDNKFPTSPGLTEKHRE